jgi:hypothetical protein
MHYSDLPPPAQVIGLRAWGDDDLIGTQAGLSAQDYDYEVLLPQGSP